jgi:hypothetical protein
MDTVYAYLSHRVRIGWHADCHYTRAFLQAYLHPFFEVLDGAASPCDALQVDVFVGPAPPEAPPLDEAELFTIDTSKGFLHCTGRRATRDGLSWVRMEPSGALLRIDRPAGRITVWAASDPALAIPLLRVIEDWTLNEAQNHGAVVLHASAVASEGRAFLLVGNKKAGKTTGLCRLLEHFDADKIANDNVCLFRSDGRLCVRGWPAFFKVSVGTLACTLPLAGDFPQAARPFLDDDAALWEVYDKVALYPAQGAARFGATVQPDAQLAAIYFPTFRLDQPPSVDRIGAAEALVRLRECLQGLKNANHCEWLGLNPVDEAALLDTLQSLAAAMQPGEVGLYSVTWAPAFEDLLAGTAELRPHRKAIRRCRAAAKPPADEWPPLPPA